MLIFAETNKPNVFVALKRFEAKRYAELTWPNPSEGPVGIVRKTINRICITCTIADSLPFVNKRAHRAGNDVLQMSKGELITAVAEKTGLTQRMPLLW